MRTFKCFDCNYVWELPHGQGGRGIDQSCPKCGSKNVHRENRLRGLGFRRQEQTDNEQSD